MVTLTDLKIAAAGLVMVGIVVGLINLKLAPHSLLLESSPHRPRWLPWLVWILSSASALAYIALDFFASRP